MNCTKFAPITASCAPSCRVCSHSDNCTEARYAPITVGHVPLIGSTMTDEREREVARTCALRDMPRWGLEPVEENLAAYFAMVREAL